MGKLSSVLPAIRSLRERLPSRWSRKLPCPLPVQAVERARRDWLASANYYQQVRDPDLVEHAAFELKARERRYIYLLAQAKRANLRLDDVTFGTWLSDREA